MCYVNNNLSNRWTLYGAEIIPNNADMYTYTEPGNYACATNAVAATLKNCPLSTAFDLKVYRSAGGKTDGYIIQEYTAHDAKQRVLVPYDPYTSETKWGNPITFVTKDDLNERFSSSDSGTTYNSVSDFPKTGSGFGVNTKNLTIYTGFVIPAFSRICYMNYGKSPDGALIAVAPSGEIYSAFRNVGVWQNGKVR